MIKVDRNKVECPDILKLNLTPSSDGENEIRDTILFYTDPTNHNEKYAKMGLGGTRIKQSYSVYSDKTVRKALRDLFNGKCAYCESKITAIYNGDIEHFRPKAAYNDKYGEALVTPGYYWLAAEWENLLFACPFCNQTNTHEISNGTARPIEVVQGKLNQFPLLTNAHRLNFNHGNEYFTNRAHYDASYALEESERLLLKPCTDDVEKHFKYDDLGLIYKNAGLDHLEITRAETSIKVYALQRLGLVQTRLEKIIQIKAQIRRVEQALENYNNYINTTEEEKIWFEGILREELQILKRFKDENQEYAGLARYIIDKYFTDFSI